MDTDLATTSPTNFAELLELYIAEPQRLPILLATVSHIDNLLELSKRFILMACSTGALDKAQQAEYFIWIVANHTQSLEHQALAHWCSAIYYSNREVKTSLGHTEAALAHYRATQQLEKEARLSIGYASQLNLIGHIEVAETTLQWLIKYLPPDYPDWPQVYINLSYVYGNQGHYSEMLATAHYAEELAIKFGVDQPGEVEKYAWFRVATLLNQGYAAVYTLQFDLAEDLLQRADQLADQYEWFDEAGHIALAFSELFIAKGKLFTALRTLQKARSNFKTVQLSLEDATIALEEALLYERLMMRWQALQMAEIATQKFADKNIAMVKAGLLVVRLALELAIPSKARRYLVETAKLVENASTFQKALWHGYNAYIGLLEKKKEQDRQAFFEAEEASRKLLELGANFEALEIGLVATRLGAALTLPATLERFQRLAEQARGYGINAIEQQALTLMAPYQPPFEAIQSLRRAADLLVALRYDMPVEELKAHLLVGYAALYTQLIETQLASSKDLAAFSTLLEAKGGIWADLAAPLDTGEISKEWLDARARLNYWQRQLRSQNDNEAVNHCNKKISEARIAIEKTARLQTRLRVQIPLPGLVEIQNILHEDTTILEYLVGATSIWCCVLAKHEPPCWKRLCKSKKILDLTTDLYTHLVKLQAKPNSGARLQASGECQANIEQILRQFYNLLIAPIANLLHSTNQLIIVPDGYLTRLPFAALYDGDIFLGARYILSSTPSSALLALRAAHSKQADTDSVGDPIGLGYTGQPPLQHIETELKTLQVYFPNAIIKHQAETADFAWGTPPELLHIASHAKVNHQSPLLSQLELADGAFLLADILNLDLHGTRLVTLSACESGVAPKHGGMTLALSGAMLCAGAQAVLASLWAVDDRATQLLMANFYRHLQLGETPALALQQAQKVVRHAYSHPFFWAAFQLLGSTQS